VFQKDLGEDAITRLALSSLDPWSSAWDSAYTRLSYLARTLWQLRGKPERLFVL